MAIGFSISNILFQLCASRIVYNKLRQHNTSSIVLTMAIKNGILIIGPFPEPLFGVSLSNLVLEKGMKSRRIKVYRIDTSSGQMFSLRRDLGFKVIFIKNYFSLYKVFC